MPNTQPTIVVRTLIQSSDWVVDTNASDIVVGDVVKLRDIDAPAMLVSSTPVGVNSLVQCGWFNTFGDYHSVAFLRTELEKLRKVG